MNGNPLPPKKEVALALLERGSVHVHLDPRAGGVVVPAWFKRQPQLVLQVGLNMPVPIPDLRVDEDGMSCTLSFNRSPFFCIVPWSSVYAMVGDDGRGMVWPEDVPPEVALQARSREADPSAKKAGPSGAPSARPPLSVVKSPAPPAPRKTAAKATSKPRAARAEDTTSDKAKKSRAKKPRAEGSPTVVRSTSPKAKESPKGKGVLVAIQSKSPPEAKAERANRQPAPAAPAASSARREKVSPIAAAPEPIAASTPAATSPVLSGSSGARPSPSGKPGAGKTKREIPPYLRVVK
jgi:stringent starvation protein B